MADIGQWGARARTQAALVAAGAGVAAVGAGVIELRQRVARSGLAGARPDAELVRGTLARMTTPLLPDDYTTLLNPLWSARELRGRLVKVVPETDDAATLVIRPGWGWSFDYAPGQYAGIGIEVDGRWVWRSYSLTSAPADGQRHIAITVKAMPEGRLSGHLVHTLPTGTVVRLALPRGDFVLPDPPPPRVLFWTGGSGVTPVTGMLRTMVRRGTLTDVVHLHAAPTESGFIFRDELRGLADAEGGYRLVTVFDDTDGRLEVSRLPDLCPDWAEREAWVCGPTPMLDAAEAHWEAAGLRRRLHVERFSAGLSEEAEGGTVTFARSGKTTTVDGATTILEAGEAAGVTMPFGCRMGICHSCVVPLTAGRVKDLRDGTEYADHQTVQTCITAASGDCTLDV